MRNFPQGLRDLTSNEDKELFDLVWKIVQECGEEERHFNQLQSVYRGLASSWFLATVGAIGFLLFNKDGKLVPQNYLFATAICLAGMAGFILLWVLDLQVYHQLLKSAFHEGLALEFEFPWLPRIRTNMDAIDKKANDKNDHVLQKLLWFYCIGTLLIGAGLVRFVYLNFRMYLGSRHWGLWVTGAAFSVVAVTLILGIRTLKQPKLLGIEITPSKISLPAGGKEFLKVIAIRSDGYRRDITDKATWNSPNERVAKVSDGHLVAGGTPGVVEITAAFQDKSDKSKTWWRAATSVTVT